MHTYTEAGDYVAQLTATDSAGRVATANVEVSVGNTEPELEIAAPPEGGFFEFGDEVAVEVTVTDAEDGSTEDGTIDCDDVTITAALGHDEHGHPMEQYQGCEATVPTLSDDGHGAEADLFYVLSAEYTDSGGEDGAVDPLTGRDDVVLQPKRKQAQHHDIAEGVTTAETTDIEGGHLHLTDIQDGDHVSYSPANLSGIEEMVFRVASADGGGRIEVRADAPDGELLGAADVGATGGRQVWEDVAAEITDPGRTVDLYLVFTGSGDDLFNFNFVEFVGQGVALDSRPRITLTSPENGAEFDSGAGVTLSADATDVRHDIEKVEFFAGSTPIGTVTEAPYELDWDAPDGRHQVRARATSESGFTRDSRWAGILVGSEEVREPWTTYTNTEAEFLQHGDDAWVIDSGGANMWQGTDEYGSIFQPDAVGEEFTATVRIDSQEAAAARAKAGIIVRDDITLPGRSPGYVAMTMTASDGPEMLWDSDGDGSIDTSAFGDAGGDKPVWLRLERSGDVFTGSYSTDGEEFVVVEEVTVASAAARQDIGMVVTAHSADSTSRVEFADFVLDGGTDPGDPPSVAAQTDPGEPDGANGWYTSPVTVTLTADDPDADIEYRLGGGDWTGYTEPVTVDEDGEHTLEYRAGNDAGTSEPKALELAVDASAPEVAISGVEDGGTHGLLDAIEAEASAEDPVSGVASVTLALDGEEIDSPAVLQRLEPGEHLLTAQASDEAGNTAGAEAAFEITVTHDEAAELVADYQDEEVLTDKQAKKMTQHLAVAERHADKDRSEQAGKALDRFDAEVEGVADDDARTLLLAVSGALRG